KVLHLHDTGSRVKDAGIDEEIDRDRCIVFGDAGLVRHLEIRLSQIHPDGPVDEWNDQDQARPLGRWQHFAETEHDKALVFRDDLEGEKQQEDSYQECNYERKVHTDPLVRCASRQRRSAETKKFREGYAWVVLMSSELGSGKRGHPLRASRDTNAPTKLANAFLRKGTRCWSYCGRRARPQYKCSLQVRSPILLKGATWLVPHRACRTTTVLSWGFHERTGPPSCPLTFPSSPAAHQTHARTLCTECNRTRQRTHQIESPCRRNPGTSRGGLADHPRSRIAFHGDNRLAFRRSATRCQRRPRPARRDNDG